MARLIIPKQRLPEQESVPGLLIKCQSNLVKTWAIRKFSIITSTFFAYFVFNLGTTMYSPFYPVPRAGLADFPQQIKTYSKEKT